MLVIRRRAGQSIRIGDDVEIHIAEITPSRVTLGIQAPREIVVSRSEHSLTRAQNLLAADSVSADSLAKLTAALRFGTEPGARGTGEILFKNRAGGSDMEFSGRKEVKPPRQEAGNPTHQKRTNLPCRFPFRLT